MKKVVLNILDMHCTACAMNIDFDLEDLPGINKVNTNYAHQKTTVEYDEKQIQISKIIAQIAKTGYKAQLLEN